MAVTVAGLQAKIQTRTSQIQKSENSVMLCLALQDNISSIYLVILIKDFLFHCCINFIFEKKVVKLCKNQNTVNTVPEKK